MNKRNQKERRPDCQEKLEYKSFHSRVIYLSILYSHTHRLAKKTFFCHITHDHVERAAWDTYICMYIPNKNSPLHRRYVYINISVLSLSPLLFHFLYTYILQCVQKSTELVELQMNKFYFSRNMDWNFNSFREMKLN